MKSPAFFKSVLMFLIVIALFSCSDNGDPRQKTLEALGQPDDKSVEDYASYKRELWVYARTDRNIVYEFQKSASGCGGSGEWYMSRQFYADYHFGYALYDPQPVITHEPVVSAPAGEPVTISAVVTLNPKAIQDPIVDEVVLFYRSVDDSLYVSTQMVPTDSTYTADIPAELVTPPGVEYVIQATSDISVWNKWSRLPEDIDAYLISVSGTSGSVTKAGTVDTVYPRTTALPDIPEGGGGGGIFPVSP